MSAPATAPARRTRRSAPTPPASEYGKGGVYWEDGRQRWVFEIRVDGKRVRQRFLTEEEANDARRKYIGTTVGYGAAPAQQVKAYTLTDWLREFISDCYEAVSDGKMSERTVISYDAQCRLNIVPRIGHLRLTAISSENVTGWLGELRTATYKRGAKGEERPLGVESQRTAAVVLKAALNEAVRQSARTGLLVNPMNGVSLPGSTGRRGTRQVIPGSYRSKAIPPKYRKRLRDQMIADGCNHALGICVARFRLGIEVGLRQGEVLALVLDNLESSSRRLTIDHHLQRKTWRHGCKDLGDSWECGRKRGVNCTSPKEGGLVRTPGTKAGKESTRSLVLPESLWDCLMEHRRLVISENRGKPNPEQGSLLFRSPGNTAISPEQDRAAFHAISDRAGIPHYSIHSLRHTAATWLCDQGEDISVVSNILGHSGIEVTLGYVHVGTRTVAKALERSVNAWDSLTDEDEAEDEDAYEDDAEDLSEEE